jgi:hypothetical protein
MCWPTHTSLSSLRLHAGGGSTLQYNPEQEHDGRNGGLEWSDVPMALVREQRCPESMRSADGSEAEDQDPEISKEPVMLTSGEMTLSIANPGDFSDRGSPPAGCDVGSSRR